MLKELNERSRVIFNHIVESYCETGDPVGSKTLSERLEVTLSPATIRNVMADLEHLGLLCSPHTSAGRMPTEMGLRFFVHALMEKGTLYEKDQENLQQIALSRGLSFDQVLEDALDQLSTLSQCAGLVFSPKSEVPLKHVEFVRLNRTQVLVVLVTQGGLVENRLIDVSPTLPDSALEAASNYLTNTLSGKTLADVKHVIDHEISGTRSSLDTLAASVVDNGLGVLTGVPSQGGSLIIKGQSHLVSESAARGDIDKIRRLFQALEERETMMGLVDAAIKGDGIQIFIGAENELFDLSGSSLIISPYKDQGTGVVGAIGVIGPSHLNYAKVIPMVDYTSKLLSKLMDDGDE